MLSRRHAGIRCHDCLESAEAVLAAGASRRHVGIRCHDCARCGRPAGWWRYVFSRGATVVAAPPVSAHSVTAEMFTPQVATSVYEGGIARYRICRTAGWVHTGDQSKAYGYVDWQVSFDKRDASDTKPKATADDFSATSGTATINPFKKCGWIIIPIKDNDYAQKDREFKLQLTRFQYMQHSPNSVSTNPDTTQAWTTIKDDDRNVIEVQNVSVTEGQDLVFTVSNRPIVASGEGVVAGGFTVLPILSAQHARPREYYWFGSQALTFSGTPNETKQVIVGTEDDDFYENDETITLSFVDDAKSLVDSSVTATGTVIDNEAPATISFSPANPTIAEGDELEFTVTMGSVPVEGPFTVITAAADGTAKHPKDYSAGTYVFNFTGAADESFQRSVFVFPDADTSEGSETIFLDFSLKDHVYVTPPLPPRQTITVTDSASVTPALKIGDATVSEGGTLEFVISQNNVLLHPTLQGIYTAGVEILPSSTASSSDYGSFECYESTAEKAPDLDRPDDLSQLRQHNNNDDITWNDVPDDHYCFFQGNANETHWLRLNTIEDTEVESDETVRLRLTYKFYFPEAIKDIFGPQASLDTATGTITNDDINHPDPDLDDQNNPNWLDDWINQRLARETQPSRQRSAARG